MCDFCAIFYFRTKIAQIIFEERAFSYTFAAVTNIKQHTMTKSKILVSMAMAGLSFGCLAITPVTTCTVQLFPAGLTMHPEEGDEGNRKPSRPLTCTVDPDSGIEFLGQETPDFILYEIYDSNNICVGAYGDEPEFIDALFSLTGEYRISLNTAGVSYIGYVML